jgi:thioredoxin 1
MKKMILAFIMLAATGVFLSTSVVAQDAAQSNIKTLTEANFKTEIKSGIHLVDFYADWCRPCKMMKPVLEEFAGEYKSKVTVSAVNTDFNKTLSTQYNISGIPSLIVFKDGKEVKRIVGYHDKAQLLEKMAEYIN